VKQSLPLLTVDVRTEQDVVLARQRARQIATLLGFDIQGQTKIGTAASEIVRNAYRYAGGGRVTFQLALEPIRSLIITVTDKGPGIAGLEEVLAGQYISKTGMGMGLLGTRRIMDRVDIVSTIGLGTTVTMTKFMPARLPAITDLDKVRIAEVLAQGLPGDPVGEVQQQNQELLVVLGELIQRQAELVSVNKELEDTNRGVVALYAELDARADFLRKTTEVKGRFLSNMTHEFRTPLNSITALANMLLGLTDGPLTPEQGRQVGFILSSAQDLTTLVNDLLDISKVDAGKVTVRVSQFSVRDLFGALKGMLRPLLGPSNSVSLEFVEPDPRLALRSDEGKISQILRNFISNALKFTGSGTVRVMATADSDGTVKFEVSDTGVGIRAEHLSAIFEEFGQVETGIPQRFKGTGLGLPLSKRLALLLGGTVGVTSEVGIGSTFSLLIPAQYAGAQEIRLIDDGLEERPRFARQAMVIDDDDVSRYLLGGLFPGNFEVSELSEGDKAVAAVCRLKPDIAFLNIHLGSGNGAEILRQLKANGESAQIPLVAYSARPIRESLRSACAQADALLMLSSDAVTSSAAMLQVLARFQFSVDNRKG
jgi:signal transduction histidine kinase/CheY-like chemotaxis protein